MSTACAAKVEVPSEAVARWLALAASKGTAVLAELLSLMLANDGDANSAADPQGAPAAVLAGAGVLAGMVMAATCLALVDSAGSSGSSS